MKIAIGLISAIFGMLLVIYGILGYFSNIVISVITRGMYGGSLELFILVGVVLIVVGCIVYERGIKEK